MSAKEQKVLEPVRKDMELLLETIKETPELLQLLESPVISSGKKLKIMNMIFSGKIEQLTLSFFNLVITNNREEYLPGMARMYIDLFKREKGLKQASLITAITIDKEIRRDMVGMIKKAYHTEIEMKEEIDKQIIGGFVLQVEDQLLDASVTGQLRKIKKILMEKAHK